MTSARVEMNDEMMEMVNGGVWYKDTWKWIKKNSDWIIVGGSIVAGAALCATGAGAAAGAGLIAGTVGSATTVGGILGGTAGGVVSITAVMD